MPKRCQETMQIKIRHTKATILCCFLLKTEIKVSHFLGHCDTENIASYKVMEKLGMSRTGEWGGRRNKSASEDSLEYQYELYL